MFFLSALSRSNKFEPAYNVCQRLLIAAITTADNQKKKNNNNNQYLQQITNKTARSSLITLPPPPRIKMGTPLCRVAMFQILLRYQGDKKKDG